MLGNLGSIDVNMPDIETDDKRNAFIITALDESRFAVLCNVVVEGKFCNKHIVDLKESKRTVSREKLTICCFIIWSVIFKSKKFMRGNFKDCSNIK